MSLERPVPGIPGAIMRRVAVLPASLEAGKPAGSDTEARPGILHLVRPGTAIFRVSDGNLIEYAPEPKSDPDRVELLLHGSMRGALIHMRGDLPLHAATYVPPDSDAALAICGASGAGKSTLGAELSRRGWLLVGDDVTRITAEGACAIAWPSCDRIKLWRDACHAGALDVEQLDRVLPGVDKYYVMVPARDTPVRLGAILELTEDTERFALSPGEKMGLITRHTYRSAHIMPLGTQKAFVRIAAHTARATRIFQLLGKKQRKPSILADLVEQIIGDNMICGPLKDPEPP